MFESQGNEELEIKRANVQMKAIEKEIDLATQAIMEVSSLVYARPEVFDDPEAHMSWIPFK